MKKIIVRALSGLVYIAILLVSYYFGQVWFGIVALCFAALAIGELNRITATSSDTGLRSMDIVVDIISTCVLVGGVAGWWTPCWWILCLLVRMILQLYTGGAKDVRGMAYSIFGQVYLGIGLGSMVALRQVYNVALLVLILIWINDTGAYLVGSMAGRHKLFERISPNKTWEGFFGGLVLALIASVCFEAFTGSFFCNLPLPLWLLLTLIVVLTATWGDLVESLIKRSLQVKDSGTIMPGHGGVLDRIDSLLFAMPAIYLLFVLGFPF